MDLKENDRIDIQDFFIVHTPKKHLWDKVIDICIERGYAGSGILTKGCWSVYGENSCIKLDHGRKEIMLAPIQSYEKNHYVFPVKYFLSMHRNTSGILGAIKKRIIKNGGGFIFRNRCKNN